MPSLIDTSLWIGFVRPASSRRLKQFILPYIIDPSARLADPVIFELLKHALPHEVGYLQQQFAALPVLATPPDLWGRAAVLGRSCRQNGFTAGAMDLLIATVALHHGAIVLTFDSGFQKIASAGGVQVKLLAPPSA